MLDRLLSCLSSTSASVCTHPLPHDPFWFQSFPSPLHPHPVPLRLHNCPLCHRAVMQFACAWAGKEAYIRPVCAMIFNSMTLQYANTLEHCYLGSLMGSVLWADDIDIWTHRLWCPSFILLGKCMMRTWCTQDGSAAPALVQARIWRYVGPPTTVWFFKTDLCTLGNLHRISPEREFRVLVIPTLSERMAYRILTECILYRREDFFSLKGLVRFIFKVQRIAEQDGTRVRCNFQHYPGALLVTWVSRFHANFVED